MTAPLPTHPRTDPADLERIDRAVRFVGAHDSAGVLAGMLPALTGAERDALAAHISFVHAAVLVFPPGLDELRADLRDRGLAIGDAVPSVVVRERLAARHGRSAESLRVDILRAPVRGADGGACEIEIFALTAPPGAGLEQVAAGERAHQHEAHLAFEVTATDPVVLAGLRGLLLGAGRTRTDGGGHNAREGSTVLYFHTDAATGPYRRLELNIRGHHPELLAEHRRTSDGPAEQLLRLMTGAWATQAVAVAAELRLADHLDRRPAPDTAQLAELTGTHHDSLRRLLRYLASLGVLRADGDTYRTTSLGRLLRTGEEHSLHPLAVLYGGPFYRSFGELGRAVRTGREAFEHVFGAHHFPYFAQHPELADLFDRAMAASAPMFHPVADLVDFSAAKVVVDVAGGNGELLSHILRAEPHLEGVLLERAHALEAARGVLAKAGCADRCRLVTGDFTEAVPPGGDVYLLSRVLHDWDDTQCLAILRNLADAMPRHAELLVIERLLPSDGTPSLAVPWDVHMLCNVGGRERTAEHYGRLLADAGFELTGRAGLPLDGALLTARRER